MGVNVLNSINAGPEEIVGWILIGIKNLQSWVSERKSLEESLRQGGTNKGKISGEERMKELKLKARSQSKEKLKHEVLPVDTMELAERAVIRYVQQQHFSREIIALQKDQVVSKSSKLCKLNPVMSGGLLRIGDRLGKAELLYDVKHPVVLPKESPVSNLILQQIHKDVGHMGRNLMLATLRQSDLKGQNIVSIPVAYTKGSIPVTKRHIPTQSDVNQWPHLNAVNIPQIDAEIGLMIGNAVADAYTPQETLTGPSGSPYATRTRLGWAVWNMVRRTHDEQKEFDVYRTEVTAVQEIEELKNLEVLVKQSINLDFPERVIDDKQEMSQEDKKFMHKAESSLRYANGHYEIGLPFREDSVSLPDNKRQALQRLKCTENRMRKDPVFYEHYKSYMNDIIDKGYAIKLSNEAPDLHKGKVWQERVALMSDIAAMFHQVKVPPKDNECFQFYWWPNENIDGESEVYKMVVHLFGAVSSPSCANMALRKTVLDNKDQLTPEVVEAVMRHFYVDDCLLSTSSESKAVTLVHDLIEACQRGGFHLTKWTSNSREVLKSIPQKERVEDVKQLNLDYDDLTVERALGVHWSAEQDTLSYKTVIQERPFNRRGILSVVSSVYDPLGLVGPFVLPAKILLQDLCYRNIGWDEEISQTDAKIWKRWLSDLTQLRHFTVPRCLKPPEFGEVKLYQIHNFCDSSEKGYGVTSYLRITNDKNQNHCSLIMAKSRVAPLKKVTDS
ncbi:uncharacterized protein LOC102802310 [Saccoglossus kowalevskii]|uniref:Uncharacterized protein LOC102802310 n=1 Tax=Saccoglossus kowalevskii TaxID=10224 RepID=A0ABM0MGD1_SACKO|nr:PREDICTED: uncharacterized protein LOC102802310 [Saccoglossus kowalevskii]